MSKYVMSDIHGEYDKFLINNEFKLGVIVNEG